MTYILITAMLFFAAPGKKTLLTGNSHVTVTMQLLSAPSLSGTGTLAFTFDPADGIHVNTNPPFELRLDKQSPFTVVGTPVFEKTDKEYLDIATPLTFSLAPKQGTAAGTYSVKGKLNYFFCSDAEGWCNRFVQPIDLTVTVGK